LELCRLLLSASIMIENGKMPFRIDRFIGPVESGIFSQEITLTALLPESSLRPPPYKYDLKNTVGWFRNWR